MNFFISDAWAQAAPGGQGDPLMSILPLIFIFVVFYFLLIRPQSKKAKEARKKQHQVVVKEEALTQAVSQLRRTLGDDPRSPRVIETIPVKALDQVLRQLDAVLAGVFAAAVTRAMLLETVARIVNGNTDIDTGHALAITRILLAKVPVPQHLGVQRYDIEIALLFPACRCPGLFLPLQDPAITFKVIHAAPPPVPCPAPGESQQAAISSYTGKTSVRETV